MSGETHFEIYPQKGTSAATAGNFGWRFRAANGQISAVGGEGFTRREDANRAIHDFLRDVIGVEPHPPILDVDD